MLSKKEIINKEIGDRLSKLRNNVSPKLTQDKLYVELQNLIDKREVNISENEDKKEDKDENVNGDKVISKIENGHGLTLRYALAYAEYFKVSLEYIYFGTKSYKPEYDDIKELTGLSDDALNKLEHLNKKNKKIINMLNRLLSVNLLPFFIELLEAFYDHSNIAIKSFVSQFPDITFLNTQTIKGYYKKPITLKPKDLEYQSLFKISEISKKIANELEKNGGK